MQAEERRRAILDSLRETPTPLSAPRRWPAAFSVSRQIIVGDIALLRAAGTDISTTPRGYVIPAPGHRPDPPGGSAAPPAPTVWRQNSTPWWTRAALWVDVIVEHPLYGQLTGPLQLSSRYDVQQFLKRCASADAQPLSNLTEGIHLHTLSCPDSEAFRRVQQTLRELGILLSDQDT
ncbi:MAG: transcription repressor NadR [Dysosmobacter sp.]